MKNKLIAKRYAKAVMENISEDSTSFLNDISLLNKFFSDNPEVIKTADSLLYPPKRRIEIIKEISRISNNQKIWNNLFHLLVQKHKFIIIREILTELESIILEKKKQEKVHLKIAHKHPDEVLKKMKSIIADIIKKDLILDITIDPDIIGGFIASTESLVIDGSIRNNLIKFKNIVSEVK